MLEIDRGNTVCESANAVFTGGIADVEIGSSKCLPAGRFRMSEGQDEPMAVPPLGWIPWRYCSRGTCDVEMDEEEEGTVVISQRCQDAHLQ
jgi:hypothetical protein